LAVHVITPATARDATSAMAANHFGTAFERRVKTRPETDSFPKHMTKADAS
jgi:hypothetical protein